MKIELNNKEFMKITYGFKLFKLLSLSWDLDRAQITGINGFPTTCSPSLSLLLLCFSCCRRPEDQRKKKKTRWWRAGGDRTSTGSLGVVGCWRCRGLDVAKKGKERQRRRTKKGYWGRRKIGEIITIWSLKLFTFMIKIILIIIQQFLNHTNIKKYLHTNFMHIYN